MVVNVKPTEDCLSLPFILFHMVQLSLEVLGLGDVRWIGICWCIQLNTVMDDDVVVYDFEAACPVSVVWGQQLRIRSPL